MVNDLDKDLQKRFLNLLDNKQYKRLQFEVDMMGDIEKQHPLIILYFHINKFINMEKSIK